MYLNSPFFRCTQFRESNPPLVHGSPVFFVITWSYEELWFIFTHCHTLHFSSIAFEWDSMSRTVSHCRNSRGRVHWTRYNFRSGRPHQYIIHTSCVTIHYRTLSLPASYFSYSSWCIIASCNNLRSVHADWTTSYFIRLNFLYCVQPLPVCHIPHLQCFTTGSNANLIASELTETQLAISSCLFNNPPFILSALLQRRLKPKL